MYASTLYALLFWGPVLCFAIAAVLTVLILVFHIRTRHRDREPRGFDVVTERRDG
ncbi:MAG TPA: hypothetical protein VGR35_00205 [Tepidisphaeraceae bacterium]|nr:hypothetical protein [Tepidisphaeraceae bacterium]